MASGLPTVPGVPPKATPVTGTPLAASAPSVSLPRTLPVATVTPSSDTVLVSAEAKGTSSTIRMVSVPVLVALPASVTTRATGSVLSVAPGCATWPSSVYEYVRVPRVGTPPTRSVPTKPVSVSVPCGV